MNIFKRRKESIRKRLNQKKILIVGGYGVQNVGDEAQLSEVLLRLERCFPEHYIKVLTPDPDYTFKAHHKCPVGEAPKVAFFHKNESLLYSVSDSKQKNLIYELKNILLKILFMLKSNWIFYNAVLIKHNLPPFLLGAQASTLLYDLLSSDLLYFEGGGYLTGATLSRLWDGILMCRLANLFGVKVAMSGQTIGVWNNGFNKRYAKKGFESVALISLRDAIFSPQALNEIGLCGDHIFPVCDDALFCASEKNEELMENLYLKNSISKEFRSKGYYSFSIHYWGLKSKGDREKSLKKLYDVISYTLSRTNKNIIFIPMVPEDIVTMEDYLKKYPSDRIRIFYYKFEFSQIRSVIQNSEACITMKHHPIIFAIGEKVPVISLNCSAYYEHKNRGALNILGAEEFSMTLDDEKYFEKYKELFEQVISNRQLIIEDMDETLKILSDKMGVYERKLKELIK